MLGQPWIGQLSLKAISKIGGLMMNWRISQGLAGWSEIGRELETDWQHSYFIASMVFVDWQRIDIELTGTNCNAGGWIIVPR